MTKDYQPARLTEFRAWLGNFNTYAAAHLADLGIAAADLAPVTAAMTALNTALDAAVAAEAAAKAARQTRNAAARTARTEVRKLVRQLQAKAEVSDAERQALGITVPDRGRTPAPVPAGKPVAEVKDVDRQRHVIRLKDSLLSGRGKPAGVRGADVLLKVADTGDPAPAGPDQMDAVDQTTGTRVERHFAAEDVGRTAWYLFRWVNTRGQPGPWGDMISATIAA